MIENFFGIQLYMDSTAKGFHIVINIGSRLIAAVLLLCLIGCTDNTRSADTVKAKESPTPTPQYSPGKAWRP